MQPFVDYVGPIFLFAAFFISIISFYSALGKYYAADLAKTQIGNRLSSVARCWSRYNLAASLPARDSSGWPVHPAEVAAKADR